MQITSKSYGDELEIVKIPINKALTITVEVFKVPEGYKSVATNSFIHHYDLQGIGAHEDKNESMELAIKELHEQMEDFDKNNHC
jgi:hypothetical protein